MTGECPEIVDHKDRNRSNNAWDNLRVANTALNRANAPGLGKRFLKGCHKVGNKFTARIKRGGKVQHLGTFERQEDAHAAYMAKAIEIYGEYAGAV
jgi:hypothetical protein